MAGKFPGERGMEIGSLIRIALNAGAEKLFREEIPLQAGDLLRRVVGKLGKAGGHDRRAGGCIPLTSTTISAVEDLQAELRRRFLKALDCEDCRGQRLVPLREMLQNLQ